MQKIYLKIFCYVCVLAVITCFIFLIIFFVDQKNFFCVNFIDVGQGDAILVKTLSGKTILFDGGPDDKVLSFLGKNLPWFDRRIDLLVLTHPHDDHLFGQISVLRRYQVDRILYTGVQHSSPGYLTWLNLIRQKKIPLTIIDHPQKIILDNDCELQILYPQESLLGVEIKNLNDSSIVALLRFGQIRFYLGGDAEVAVENKILDKKTDISADVYKVSHHGSDNANSSRLLEMIKPKMAIISVGKNNQFGHPYLRIIKRIEKIKAKIFRTDQDGDIKIVSDGKKYWLSN